MTRDAGWILAGMPYFRYLRTNARQWSRGQAAIYMLGAPLVDGAGIRVGLKTLTPNFKTYLARVDGGEWKPAGDVITWTPHAGKNYSYKHRPGHWRGRSWNAACGCNCYFDSDSANRYSLVSEWLADVVICYALRSKDIFRFVTTAGT